VYASVKLVNVWCELNFERKPTTLIVNCLSAIDNANIFQPVDNSGEILDVRKIFGVDTDQTWLSVVSVVGPNFCSDAELVLGRSTSDDRPDCINFIGLSEDHPLYQRSAR
jgi:hypothetical protein